MTKISSSILILRKAAPSAWTNDLNDEMNQWLLKYIDWLEHSPLALREKATKKFVSPLIYPPPLVDPVSLFNYSNHGTFYVNQIAAIKILLGDKSGAVNVLGKYFDGIYKNQINQSRANKTISLPRVPFGRHDRESRSQNFSNG